MEKYNFETIFTSDNVMNIQYGIGKGFGYREISLYMEVNIYFPPRRTHIPHATPNYGLGQ